MRRLRFDLLRIFVFDDTLLTASSKRWDSALNIHDYSIDDLHFSACITLLTPFQSFAFVCMSRPLNIIAVLRRRTTDAAAMAALPDYAALAFPAAGAQGCILPLRS